MHPTSEKRKSNHNKQDEDLLINNTLGGDTVESAATHALLLDEADYMRIKKQTLLVVVAIFVVLAFILALALVLLLQDNNKVAPNEAYVLNLNAYDVVETQSSYSETKMMLTLASRERILERQTFIRDHAATDKRERDQIEPSVHNPWITNLTMLS